MSLERPRPGGPGLTPVDFDPFGADAGAVELPLTDSQQEVWMAAQMSPAASVVYNECAPLRLVGPLSIPSMRAAVQQLAVRHEALRVSFAAGGGRQTIAPSVVIPVTLRDLSDLPRVERDREIGEILLRQRRDPFNLANGPLARVAIVREMEDRHLVILTAHHLVCDGWSTAILLQDLAGLYTADLHGISAALPEPMRYSDHVRQATSASLDRSASEAYWLQRLSGELPVLELPTDRPRPPIKTYEGSHEFVRVEPDLHLALKRAAARHGCTLYVMLLAAWQALLSRVTGQTDLVIGIPVAGQAGLDNSHLAGHFVQMLPLRTDVTPSATFSAQLRVTRQALIGAQEHQAVTFGHLIQHLGLPRDSSRTPLISAVFNVDKIAGRLEFAELSVERLVAPRVATNFELGLDMADTGTEVSIECNYNVNLFDALTIRRWLGWYHRLLSAVASNPDVRVDQIPLVSEDERSQLRTWGAAAAEFPTACLHRSFEEQAARVPGATALQFEGESLTYAELNGRANQLAHRLLALGVGPDVLVGLAVERSLELVVGILGILKAGGAYLPLDPAYPSERLAFMLSDASPRVIVTTEGLLAELPPTLAPVVCLDRDAPVLESYGAENPQSAVEPRHLAYVIYTSGSTGRPKGVLVEHGHVSRLLSATDAWFGFGPGDVWTLFHSFAFDFSVWELWGSLLYGGRLVVVPYWVSRSPLEFRDLLARERVTVLNHTPSAFRQLIEADKTAPSPDLALRVVIFGGEALDPAMLGPWVERYGDERPELVNMYGITETTVHVSYRRLTATDVRDGIGSVIGVPIPDLSVQLLGTGGELVPVGMPGELYVGGAGVARGYLNRPELTTERFVVNHVIPEAGDRLYRSGDLARWLPSGELEYLGRIDQQVKIRGFRIELGEITATLNEHPAVRDSVVVYEPGVDPRLIGYVVTDGAGAVSDLTAHLRSRLPDYMVPQAFVFLDQLPMTANGKLDRGRLPSAARGPAAERSRQPPRTPTEEAIARVWQDVLGGGAPGALDNFFDLGGHSVLAVKIVSRLRDMFGIDLPVSVIFHRPTIAALGEAVDALAVTARQAHDPPSAEREEIEL